MPVAGVPPPWRWLAWAFCIFAAAAAAAEVSAFWSVDGANPSSESHVSYRAASRAARLDSRPDTYVLALRELQELESEPLCHRIAARLLVNNCQLLDGQDEAAVLIDSGRATRDFVDFFAASLAICDLERGSFTIPRACSKFRESSLAGLPVPSTPQLHLSTSEIDGCLEGLAQSDSAWNTWVSYRHKALRFCEAARSDNEKDQNIHLYKRITKILAKLTTQVETDAESRLNTLNKKFRDASANMDRVAPYVDELKDRLLQVEQVISEVVSRRAEEAAAIVQDGLADAQSLQQLLSALRATIVDNDEKTVRSHESALQHVSDQAKNEIGFFMTTLSAALISSASLAQELTDAQSRTTQMAQKQKKIEAGMERLAEMADALTVRHEHHQQYLNQAQQSAEQVLRTLDSVTTTASTFKSSILDALGFSRWWPFVFCPATTLVVGSYGLPPSAARNIALVGLGTLEKREHYGD
ncbi:nuclear membrane fusion protein Kar5 [Drechmeria coniospora]|uniref:Nuclear membrane fusion protein Kar5 n=1 Tax=Drechmeria coniospora TaxID=98403 RepID=A0A151GDF3_DRECN|nr:nuclear membrane fusion protein Kar5 [Drechmeria coniospora]KYK55083.1 nuclear membrane fusion protein Kar5 [Drechmeria coniospora]